jgi:hypothetical protein
VWLESLFPCHAPEALVYAPPYKLKDRYFTRGLTMSKRLQLHQLPLAMDPLLVGLNPGTPCPFEDSPSPEVYTLVFGQLWGTCVGGVHGIRWLEVKEEVNEGEEMVEEVKKEEAMGVGRMEEVKKEEAEEMVEEVKKEEAMVVGRMEEVKKEEAMVVLGKMVKTNEMVGRIRGEMKDNGLDLDELGSGNTRAMDDVMTVSSTRPDTPSQPDTAPYVFDFNFGDDTGLTDQDTITSLASEETLCHSGQTRDEYEGYDDPDDPENEKGPSPMENPGQPFKVGDIILCDIPGQLWGMDPMVNWLQQGFVMEANHLRYMIRLEKRATVWTNTWESWLQP